MLKKACDLGLKPSISGYEGMRQILTSGKYAAKMKRFLTLNGSGASSTA